MENSDKSNGFKSQIVDLKTVHTVTVTITLMGCTFDLSDGHYDGQNWLHTHFARQCNVCDGVACCE